MDEWLPHGPCAIQLRHEKRSKEINRELKPLRPSEDLAQKKDCDCCRWWHNNDRLHEAMLTVAYFDGWGLPRLSEPQTVEPPDLEPYAGCDVCRTPVQMVNTGGVKRREMAWH